MLRNYSKINYPVEAVKTGRIGVWKGEKKDRYYVNEISVDWASLLRVKDR